MAAPAPRPIDSTTPVFRAPYAEDDGAIAGRLLAGSRREPAAKARIDARASGLIEAIRTRKVGLGGIEELLREYSLSTKEGLALMVLAEALAARARRRHRRPADRGQARPGRLRPS